MFTPTKDLLTCHPFTKTDEACDNDMAKCENWQLCLRNKYVLTQDDFHFCDLCRQNDTY